MRLSHRCIAAGFGDAREIRDAQHLTAAWGSMAAPISTCSAAADDPNMPESAERSILRLWAKAASTTAKTSSLLAVVTGGSRRVSDTNPESTFGTGQNTVGGTLPTRLAAQYQASFAEGTP